MFVSIVSKYNCFLCHPDVTLHVKLESQAISCMFLSAINNMIAFTEDKITTVVATPGSGPDRSEEVAYTDTKIIGKPFANL